MLFLHESRRLGEMGGQGSNLAVRTIEPRGTLVAFEIPRSRPKALFPQLPDRRVRHRLRGPGHLPRASQAGFPYFLAYPGHQGPGLRDFRPQPAQKILPPASVLVDSEATPLIDPGLPAPA